MKKIILSLAILFSTTLAYADEKKQINPDDFICAELNTAVLVDNTPPIEVILQIDGYAAADQNLKIADKEVLNLIFVEINSLCQSKPEAKVLPMWINAVKKFNRSEKSEWHVETTTCKQYIDNEDDGSNFAFWLDAYNSKMNKNTKSILDNHQSFEKYFNSCKENPDKLMYDMMKNFK